MVYDKVVHMKTLSFTFLLVLLSSGSLLTFRTVAQGDGPSASGAFKISMENGQSRDIKFNARQASDGNTSGEITFQDSATDKKSTANNSASEAALPFYARANCDCLMIKGIEAVLSGTITEASQETYVGRRVLLVVQDGDSLTPPLRDKLTFGFYRNPKKGWLATDAERPDEQGPPPTWVATDAERSDDTGVMSQKNEEITCESFPISSHSFIGSKVGKGKIEVHR